MKKKQYFELGKFSLVLAQIVFGTRLITNMFSREEFHLVPFLLSAGIFVILTLMGIYLVGKGSD